MMRIDPAKEIACTGGKPGGHAAALPAAASESEELTKPTSMQMITSKTTEPRDKPDQPCFPLDRIKKLLLALKVSLGRGSPMSFEDWSQFVGRPGNTLSSWCADGQAYQVQALLASLERLPESERHHLIDEACRLHPTLLHRRLAHDFLAVSSLAALLLQRSGLTAIQGGLDHARTFLATALGHSFHEFGASGVLVTGIDVHRPDTFVPVVGVSYLFESLHPTKIADQIRQAWPAVRGAKARLVLLNGVWSKTRDLHREIIDLARRAHVIVADQVIFPPEQIVETLPCPLHLVTVTPARECPEWLRVEIQAP
jgi:hypothetical protein